MKRLLWLAIILAALQAGAARAVTFNCLLTPAVPSFSFGNYGGQFNNNINQTFTVTCTQSRGQSNRGPQTVDWIVNFDPGNSGNTTQEYMLGTNFGGQLNYNLYQDPAHTIPLGGDFDANATEQWNSPGNSPITFAVGQTSSSTTFTVYAEIPASQTGLPADTYNDTMFYNLNDSTGVNYVFFQTINISAAIPASCNLGSAANVAFGALDPSTASGDITVTSHVTELCTLHTPFGVVMDTGLHATTPGDPTTRRMMDATGDYLPYHLYVDTGHTQEIGTTPNTVTGTGNYLFGYGQGTGPGNAVTVNFYAVVKLSDLQIAPAGTYSDTVTVTVYY